MIDDVTDAEIGEQQMNVGNIRKSIDKQQFGVIKEIGIQIRLFQLFKIKSLLTGDMRGEMGNVPVPAIQY